MTSTDETGPALPHNHVRTLRVATPNPRHAKRHLLVRSGWTHYYVGACLVNLPKDCCELGSAPIEDIECPYCREAPEFRRALEAAHTPDTLPPETTATAATPSDATAPPRPQKRPRKKIAGPPPAATTDPQGSLF